MPTRFLWDNQWDRGALTIATGGENANFPATNTQHRWWQKTFRNTSASSSEIICDDPHQASGATSIKCGAIKYNNFTASAVVKFFNDDNIGFTSPDFEYSFATISQDVMVGYFPTTETNRYWLLQTADATVPDGYHEIGRVYLGSYWTPGRDFRIGGGRRNRIDTSLMTTGEHGHISTVVLDKRNVYEYVFPCLSASDLTQFIAIFDGMGMSRGFFFTEDSTVPATTTYYVRFAAPLGIQQEENGLYTVSVSLVESM